ncbi:MAG TPA: hypothetical protein PK482_03960 [Spirochaetota bacterium]|jgi:hypothetical protein|nr:hypothetical protein [Spirochaetota bacterium]HOV08251.1 hypothetical protein [Spirochaetota bacterium]
MDMIKKKDSKDLVALNNDEVRELLPLIMENSVPIMRKKRDGTFAFIPPAEFDQYLKEQDLELYIYRDEYTNLIKKITMSKKSPSNERDISTELRSSSNSTNQPHSQNFDFDSIFKSEIKTASEMSMLERLQSVINNNYKIKNLIAQNSSFDREVAGHLSSIFSKTLCINKVTLEENINQPVGGEHLGRLIAETENVVDNLITLLSNGKSTYSDLARLDFVQTGSTTLNHMNRMLIRFIAFFFYYNSYFVTHSNEVKRLRSRFKEKFLPYYDRLFNSSQNISLEIVFKGGISPVTDRKTFLEFALGGFFHDIGKIPEIEYHDSDEGFIAAKARRHVFDSYNMLLTAEQFSLGVVAMGLLHHDYYNAPYGYRQRETLRKKFDRRQVERADTIITRYAMSKNIMDVVYGNSLSYFPSKILELLDVFDAMTDHDKKYKKISLEPEEALLTIKREFIDSIHLGIDPILFNIFIDFLKDSHVLPDNKSTEAIKI